MRGVIAGVLFAGGIFGLIFRPVIGFFKDVPLGPVNIWERDPAQAKRNDEANVAAQNRLWEHLRYLWIVGVMFFIAGGVVLAL